MVRGALFYVDIKPDIPITLSAKTERDTYLLFTPKASKIYCVFGESLGGVWWFRPNIELIDKQECEQSYIALERRIPKIAKYQRRWWAKYLTNERQPKLPSGWIYRSYDDEASMKSLIEKELNTKRQGRFFGF